MPAELLGSIEVVKAITPDMDADAVGGNINLVTRQPIGERTIFNLSAAGGLHEMGYGANGMAGIHFGQSRGPLSYMLRANFRRNDRVMDDVRHFWGTANFGNGGVDVLDQLRLSSYEIRRFLVGCRSQEVTGCIATPDNRTLFINLQHPGDDSESNPVLTSHWSDGGDARPRSAVVVVTRDDDGVVGG
jgi:hypothetical protein